MRAIYINGRYLTQRTTGVQRFASEIVRALDEQISSSKSEISLPVFLVIPAGKVPIPSLKNIRIIQGVWLHGHPWEQFELPFIARSGLLFNPCGPAPIFHSHQVTSLHDASIHVAPAGYSWKFRMWHKLLMWRSGRNARLILTVSKFSMRQLISICGIPEEKIRVIYQSGNHILREPADPSILDKYGLNDGTPYILCVGSQQANKNFASVVQAAALLQNKNFRFVVVGSADLSIYRGPILMHERMVFTGYITDKQLRALYEHAACFVFPSLYEGFGIPPLEAMACGCPVLASNASSIPEACGQAALYFDPKRPDLLAAEIIKILTNVELHRQLIALGLQHTKVRTWQDVSRELSTLLWTSVVSSDQAGPGT